MRFQFQFIASLGTLQFFFLLGKGLLFFAGVDVPWIITLAPLWFLLSIVIVFWVLIHVIWKAFNALFSSLT